MGFSPAFAQDRIELETSTALAEFTAATALPSAFGAGALAPTSASFADPVSSSAPNSFDTPLYGAPVATAGLTESPGVFENEFAVDSFSDSSGSARLDWSASDSVRAYKAERKAARLIEPLEMERDFSASLAFAAPNARTGFGFDVGIAPRLEVRDEGDFSTRSVGAEVRIGQRLDGRGQEGPQSWYFFAGADDEALVWEAGDNGFANITSAMKLRDQITVGDMQAGVSVQRGGGQLSLSYIRREVEYKDRNGGHSQDEHFAGVSFTLRR